MDSKVAKRCYPAARPCKNKFDLAVDLMESTVQTNIAFPRAPRFKISPAIQVIKHYEPNVTAVNSSVTQLPCNIKFVSAIDDLGQLPLTDDQSKPKLKSLSHPTRKQSDIKKKSVPKKTKLSSSRESAAKYNKYSNATIARKSKSNRVNPTKKVSKQRKEGFQVDNQVNFLSNKLAVLGTQIHNGLMKLKETSCYVQKLKDEIVDIPPSIYSTTIVADDLKAEISEYLISRIEPDVSVNRECMNQSPICNPCNLPSITYDECHGQCEIETLPQPDCCFPLPELRLVDLNACACACSELYSSQSKELIMNESLDGSCNCHTEMLNPVNLKKDDLRNEKTSDSNFFKCKPNVCDSATQHYVEFENIEVDQCCSAISNFQDGICVDTDIISIVSYDLSRICFCDEFDAPNICVDPQTQILETESTQEMYTPCPHLQPNSLLGCCLSQPKQITEMNQNCTTTQSKATAISSKNEITICGQWDYSIENDNKNISSHYNICCNGEVFGFKYPKDQGIIEDNATDQIVLEMSPSLKNINICGKVEDQKENEVIIIAKKGKGKKLKSDKENTPSHFNVCCNGEILHFQYPREPVVSPPKAETPEAAVNEETSKADSKAMGEPKEPLRESQPTGDSKAEGKKTKPGKSKDDDKDNKPAEQKPKPSQPSKEEKKKEPSSKEEKKKEPPSSKVEKKKDSSSAKDEKKDSPPAKEGKKDSSAKDGKKDSPSTKGEVKKDTSTKEEKKKEPPSTKDEQKEPAKDGKKESSPTKSEKKEPQSQKEEKKESKKEEKSSQSTKSESKDTKEQESKSKPQGSTKSENINEKSQEKKSAGNRKEKTDDDSKSKEYLKIIQEKDLEIQKLTELLAQAQKASEENKKKISEEKPKIVNKTDKNIPKKTEIIKNEDALKSSDYNRLENKLLDEKGVFGSGSTPPCECSIVVDSKEIICSQFETCLQDADIKHSSKDLLSVQVMPSINIRPPLIIQNIPSVLIQDCECIPQSTKPQNVAYDIIKCVECDEAASANVGIQTCALAQEHAETQIDKVFTTDADIQVRSYDNFEEILNEPLEHPFLTNKRSTISQWVQSQKAVNEFVQEMLKDPDAEIVYKSYQLLNEHAQHKIEEVEVDQVALSQIDVDVYKTFVNPAGFKGIHKSVSYSTNQETLPGTLRNFYSNKGTQCNSNESIDNPFSTCKQTCSDNNAKYVSTYVGVDKQIEVCTYVKAASPQVSMHSIDKHSTNTCTAKEGILCLECGLQKFVKTSNDGVNTGTPSNPVALKIPTCVNQGQNCSSMTKANLIKIMESVSDEYVITHDVSLQLSNTSSNGPIDNVPANPVNSPVEDDNLNDFIDYEKYDHNENILGVDKLEQVSKVLLLMNEQDEQEADLFNTAKINQTSPNTSTHSTSADSFSSSKHKPVIILPVKVITPKVSIMQNLSGGDSFLPSDILDKFKVKFNEPLYKKRSLCNYNKIQKIQVEGVKSPTPSNMDTELSEGELNKSDGEIQCQDNTVSIGEIYKRMNKSKTFIHSEEALKDNEDINKEKNLAKEKIFNSNWVSQFKTKHCNSNKGSSSKTK